jgi:PKD repeat protein
VLTGAFSCSKGIGNNRKTTAPVAGTGMNLPTGLDVGVALTDAAAEPVVAGLVLPAIGATPAREVLLVAFSTAAAADDADGAGTPLSRDTTSDGNGASDIFVALVCAQDIETRAFSQSLAGKFRHPRCATCHSMAVPGTLAFVSSASGAGQPHAGPPPGDGFPNNSPETCAPCHVNSSTFPVVRWQAPAASFDIKSKSVAEIAMMAMNVPVDETEHFVSDPRVLWALDSGILPQVGGRNGIADDDHDGIFEPEDIDGVPRTVPGGSVSFLHEIEEWRASGMVVSTADAVKDVTLVSRQSGTSNAATGASTSPRIVWVPNGSFDPADAVGTNPVGTLYVAFQSTATNVVTGDTNGVMDVFRAAVQVRAEEDPDGAASAGGLNLLTLDTTILCSAINASTNEGNGASGGPAISGPNAEFVAFHSVATNLVAGFANNNGTDSDVFVRKIGTNTTQLVSHANGNATAGGNGASEAPSISANGSFLAVAFESDADNLLSFADGNAVRDVFYADVSGAGPFVRARASVTDAGAEGTGGDCRHAAVWTSDAGRVLCAFESDKTDLDATKVAATNVFLFDSDTGATALLNRLFGPSGNAIGDGSARAPEISVDGRAVAFESDANNIDALRDDGNRDTDVFLVETAQVAAGLVLPLRFSITATESADANGPSTRPFFGTFTDDSNYDTGFACYVTGATNLGTSDTTNVMVTFLDESAGVLVDFTATPAAGAIPLQVQFEDRSSGLPTEWEWDFGDGGTSTLENPVHTYTTPGTYTVTLIARNPNTEGTKTEVDFVQVAGPVAADFTTSPVATGGAPLTVLFDDASTQPNGAITGWQWDFDNNGTIDSTAQNASFTYATPGTYNVRLIATGLGTTGTTTKNGIITVQAPGALVAGFTSVVAGSPVGGRGGTAVGSVWNDEEILFTDTSTGTVTSHLWDFGDGTTSTAANPVHLFTTPGTYNVVLQVTGPDGTDYEVKPALIVSLPGDQPLDLVAVADTTIYQSPTNTSNGGGTRMIVGRPLGTNSAGQQNIIRRGLVQFDLSSIPAGSVITGANLRIVSDTPVATGARTITINRINQLWTEGTALGGGEGAPTAGGGATWANRSFSTAWGTAGGSFNGTSSGSLSVNSAGTHTSSSLVSDVQGWVNGTFDNNGWILRNTEGTAGTVKRFLTRESGSAPLLKLTFRQPLP